MSAQKVAVYFTLKEIQTLRGLIVREAKQLGHGTFQHASEEPAALKRLKPVAKKIWEARQAFVDAT